MSSAAGDGEATLRPKTKTKKKKHKAKHGDVEVAPSHASKPPKPAAPFRQTPPQSPAPGIPTLEEAMRRTKEQGKRKTQQQQQQQVAMARNPSLAMAPSPAPSHTLEEGGVMRRKKECKTRKQQAPILEEAMRTKEKGKRKTRERQQQVISSPSPPAAVGTPIFEQVTKGKKKQKQSKEQAPLPFIPGQILLQETQAPPEQEPEAGGRKGKCIKNNNGKKHHVPVLSNRQLIRQQLINRKEKALPQGMLPFEYFVENCTDSPPYSAFFEQFRCDPVRRDRKPALPRTPHSLAMLPPRGHPSFDSSQLNASACRKSSVASKTNLKVSGSGSASGSLEKVNVMIKKTPVTGTKKQRKKPPLLTTAEKRSDKYRRVPLDQLVPPPCSPHKLLQEKYASDPWKVIVICMFLNLTQGKQVRKIVEGFFERYPDPVSAFNADPKEMEVYLAPLGLQCVKTRNIQKLSKQYVEEEWKYVTELCGVGKYAADAYSIFCAGRAKEVEPEDHKLVDYWKYICFDLPKMEVFSTHQDLVNVEEAGVTEQNNVSPGVGESVVCQHGSLG